MIELRDYQDPLFERLVAAMESGKRSAILFLPTGGGKTSVAARAAKHQVDRGNRGAFIVHRVELERQSSRDLHIAGVPHGFVDAKHHGISDHQFHVVSIDTLLRRLDSSREWLGSLRHIWVDEAHRINAPKYQACLSHASLSFICGMTATPWRENGQSLRARGEAFEMAIRGPSYKTLISEGWLTKPEVIAPPPVIDGAVIPIVRGEYDERTQEKLLNTAEVSATAIRYYALFCPGASTIVQCVGVHHAQAVADAFCSDGWPAAAVWGDMAPAERRSVLEGFERGSVRIICNADLISEGLDIRGAEVAIWLMLTKSTRRYLQLNGRLSRPVWARGFDLSTASGRLESIAAGRKPRSLIIDLVGVVKEHGMPDADRPWTLLGGVKGFAKQVDPVRRCPRCWRVGLLKESSCQKCGRVHQSLPTHRGAAADARNHRTPRSSSSPRPYRRWSSG